jgi:hypothetical protein
LGESAASKKYLSSSRFSPDEGSAAGQRAGKSGVYCVLLDEGAAGIVRAGGEGSVFSTAQDKR